MPRRLSAYGPGSKRGLASLALLAGAVLLGTAAATGAEEGASANVTGLVGAWQAKSGGGPELVTTRLTLQADGRFVRQDYGPSTTPLAVWGRYRLLDDGRIELSVDGWSPQQSCTKQGCTLVRPPSREQAQVRLIGPSLLLLRQTLFSRVQ
jgi:hypothetical protein